MEFVRFKRRMRNRFTAMDGFSAAFSKASRRKRRGHKTLSTRKKKFEEHSVVLLVKNGKERKVAF
jgi:hypothetical protein